MALVASKLELELNLLSQKNISPEEANREFANIICAFMQTATVNVNVTGVGNMGVPVQSVGIGQIS